MHPLLTGVLLCLIAASSGGFLTDLISSKGWHLGDGLVLHLANSRHPNSTFLERYSIMMDYGGYGVSVSKVPRRRALELDLYARGFREVCCINLNADLDTFLARAKRHRGNPALSLIIGFKMATMAAIALSAVGALVLKAFIAAKLAAVMSTVLLLSKLFHHENPKSKNHVEIQAPPIEIEAPEEVYSNYVEVPPSGLEYQPSASSGYYTYANYDYVPESPGVNATFSAPGDQQVARRRDGVRRRKVPLVTIRHSINS